MRILLCVDDTDDLTKSTSTGKIADMIMKKLVLAGGIISKGITRHQLLLHEDIAYTSHNSSMCMDIIIEGVTVDQMKKMAEEVLHENMAESSDPGLCFCRLDQLKNPEAVIAYGKRAQKEVIQKQEAYDLAKEIGGTVLEEYGGTGIGVIGALAGVGLRLSGCDGTVRGGKGLQFDGESFSVSKWKTMMGIEQVLDFQGKELENHIQVRAGKKIKTAFIDNKVTLVTMEKDGEYVACSKKDLYENDRPINKWNTPCDKFEIDNDSDECYSEDEKACYNCLYRRWTTEGYSCVIKP